MKLALTSHQTVVELAVLPHSSIALTSILPNINHQESVPAVNYGHEVQGVEAFVVKILRPCTSWFLDGNVFPINCSETGRKVPVFVETVIHKQ